MSETKEDYGTSALNLLNGGAGDDVLTAIASATARFDDGGVKTADNRLIGGLGDDTLSGEIVAGDGKSVLNAGRGDDVLTILGGQDNVGRGGSGNDLVQGGGNADRLFGEADSDALFGGAGSDMLHGASGEDTLQGGLGDDTLFGGADTDTLAYDLTTDEGTDTILGFRRAMDRLAFSGVVDAGSPGLADDLDAISTITDGGIRGDVEVAFDVGTVLIFVNRGTGTIDSIADLMVDPSTQLLGEVPFA